MIKNILFLILLFTASVAFSSGRFESEQPEGALPPGSAAPGGQNGLITDPGAPPANAAREFSTDFSRTLVPFDSIFSGGPPRDGIPPIDEPVFTSITEAVPVLADREPVLAVTAGGRTKIYPLRILMWHEIVNDTLDGNPLIGTYCPLCNTGIAFSRETESGLLDFGTTGRLRYSNLIMYDRQTESWWQQATGEAIIGELAGERLTMIPALMLSWKQALSQYPDALVLSDKTGHDRPYGRNPYQNYDSSGNPFLYTGPDPGSEHKPLDRILAVEAEGGTLMVAYSELKETKIKQFEPEKVVVFFEEDTASALDSALIAEGSPEGSALAFSTGLDGENLFFLLKNDTIIDRNTGSTWSPGGVAVKGPLTGRALQPLVSVNHFWFSFNAFYRQ